MNRGKSIVFTMPKAAVIPAFEDAALVQSPQKEGMPLSSVLASPAMFPHPLLFVLSLQEWEKKQT